MHRPPPMPMRPRGLAKSPPAAKPAKKTPGSTTPAGLQPSEITLPPPPACPHGVIYTVRPGDTLFLIARRFEMRLDRLVAANPQITDPDVIYPGQKICIPRRHIPPLPPEVPGCIFYMVRPGDTLFMIARRFGVDLQDLINANPQIDDPDVIYPGQVICIPIS